MGMIKIMSKNKEVYDNNIRRVKSLCALYNSLKTSKAKDGKNYKLTDILRSATVMLHSSFEEYFRCTLRDVLSKQYDENTIKSLDMKSSDGKHKEKFTLSELVQYKGKTINDFIVDQINFTLDSTSFNNYSDVFRWSEKMNISLHSFSKQGSFENLVARRHKIVHEADNNKEDQYQLTSIQESTVKEWIDVVCYMVELIESQLEK